MNNFEWNHSVLKWNHSKFVKKEMEVLANYSCWHKKDFLCPKDDFRAKFKIVSSSDRFKGIRLSLEINGCVINRLKKVTLQVT